MTRFIIFACLLAVQFNHGLSVTTVTYSKQRGSPDLIIRDTDATKCIVVSNKGTEYSYEPGFDIFENNPKIRRQSYSSCSISVIHADETDRGIWKITQYNQNGKSTTYEFNICYETFGHISPGTNIEIYKGHYAIARITDELEDIVACEITPPKKGTFDIFTTEMKNVERFDICGVRIMVDDEFEGKWNLAAINDNNEVISAEFFLDVQSENNLLTDQQNISLKLGSTGEIRLTNIESSYCQLTDPHGVQLPLNMGQCEHTIDVVTPYHRGLWTATYGIHGRLEPIKIDVMVTTYDPEAVIISVNVTENSKKIHMACHLQIQKYLKYCFFVSPTGNTLHISPGIGVGRYEFYEGEDNGVNCGITVNDPKDVDFGTWRCEIGVDDQNRNRYGSFLYVERSNSESLARYSIVPSQNIRTAGYDVSVKLNDDFTIKCTADTILQYCWLRSPNGTTYSITTEKESLSSNTLLYEGLNLQQGECGAIIKNAVYEHEGTWNCYMGVKNHSEIEATVRVNVEESYLLPKASVLTYNEENSLRLECHLLPNLKKNIDYCRWIRPDGHGIYGDARHRYMSESYEEHCSLAIPGEELRREDVGRWTCIAGLSGRTIQEVSATIDVNAPSMQIATLAGIIIGACALLTIVASVLIFLNLRKRRSMLPPKNPPPYDTEHIHGIPSQVLTNEQIHGIPAKVTMNEQIRYDQKNWVD